MVAFYDPDPGDCPYCGGTGYAGTYPTHSHPSMTGGVYWGNVTYVAFGSTVSALKESFEELIQAMRNEPRPWRRDAKPDVPRKLGFRRYAFLAPAARVRMNSVQFAIL